MCSFGLFAHAQGAHARGVHVEMTGQEVTECTGGAQAITDEALATATIPTATRA
jgi:3-deoxy-7-phosphoheptulonate synthase